MLSNIYNRISDTVVNSCLVDNVCQNGITATAGLISAEFIKAAVSSGIGKFTGLYAEQALTNWIHGNPVLEYGVGTALPIVSAILNAKSAYDIASNASLYMGAGSGTAKNIGTASAVVAGVFSLYPLTGAIKNSVSMGSLAGAQFSNMIAAFSRETINETVRGVSPKLSQAATGVTVVLNALEHGGVSVGCNVELAGSAQNNAPDESSLKTGLGSPFIAVEHAQRSLMNGVASGAENVTGAMLKLALYKDVKITSGNGWKAAHELSVNGLWTSLCRITQNATSRMIIGNASLGVANTVVLFTGMDPKNAQRLGQALQFGNPFRSEAVKRAEKGAEMSTHAAENPQESHEVDEMVEVVIDERNNHPTVLGGVSIDSTHKTDDEIRAEWAAGTFMRHATSPIMQSMSDLAAINAVLLPPEQGTLSNTIIGLLQQIEEHLRQVSALVAMSVDPKNNAAGTMSTLENNIKEGIANIDRLETECGEMISVMDSTMEKIESDLQKVAKWETALLSTAATNAAQAVSGEPEAEPSGVPCAQGSVAALKMAIQEKKGILNAQRSSYEAVITQKQVLLSAMNEAVRKTPDEF